MIRGRIGWREGPWEGRFGQLPCPQLGQFTGYSGCHSNLSFWLLRHSGCRLYIYVDNNTNFLTSPFCILNKILQGYQMSAGNYINRQILSTSIQLLNKTKERRTQNPCLLLWRKQTHKSPVCKLLHNLEDQNM